MKKKIEGNKKSKERKKPKDIKGKKNPKSWFYIFQRAHDGNSNQLGIFGAQISPFKSLFPIGK